MAQPQLTPQKIQEIRNLAAQWGKIIARRAFGDTGPQGPVSFHTLEQLAHAAAQGLTEGTLVTLLEQLAQTLPEQLPCPDCGLLCPVGREKRLLTIAGGQPIPLDEPLCHCPDCRRDFFPPKDYPAAG
jgi:Zn finger protein HypA/HybF involved in hydrogenase expression